MKILVEGIPSAGREVDFGLREAWARDAASTALDRDPTRLAGRITLTRATGRGVVLVAVRAEAAGAAICDRCGEACDLVVTSDVRLLYAPEEKGSAAFDGTHEIELEPDELELGWYEHGELSLEDVLREALTLALPTRVTCADTPGCDKRTDALLATAKVADGPFAVLARLKPASDAEN